MVEKKLSTALSQDADVGVKWNTHRGWSASHVACLGVLVGGIVVEDGVDDLAGRHGAFHGIEEADELAMAMLAMQRPRTTPLSTLRAANSVVMPPAFAGGRLLRL